MKTQTLEDAVAETAATAAGWHSKVANIETQLAAATKHREQNALAAALGDQTATAAIRHEADLAIALPAARLALAAAERAATAARHELAKLHGTALMRQRVIAAARMDAALSECAAAYADFDRLGREIQSLPDLRIAQSGNVSDWERAQGYRRIAAALPPFFVKLLSSWSHQDKWIPLAVSEQNLWSLPPAQPETAKAA